MSIFSKLRELEKGEARQLLKKRIWTLKARALSTSLRSADREWPASDDERASIVQREGELARGRPRAFFCDYPELKSMGGGYLESREEERRAIIEEADAICGGDYCLFGEKISFEGGIDWHWDPSRQRHWPKLFFADIVYANDPECGDIKIAWELGRHQHLGTLALAYCLSGNELYAKEAAASIESWIDENRPYLGIHWISALEVGLRLISWIWCFQLIKESPGLEGRFVGKMLRSVRTQCDYLEHNLSIGRYANNHVVGEAAALAMAGLYFSEWRCSKRWAARGLAILEHEVIRQIHPDGGGAEQATSYLRFIVELCLQAFLLARKNRRPVRPEAFERIEKALEFLMHNMMPDGREAVFGDSDDARALPLGRGEYWDYRGLFALGAVLFGRGDLKSLSTGPSPELCWLLGEKGLRQYELIKPDPPRELSRLFPQSGYGIIRDGWGREASFLMIDCGPLGYKSGGHGHADALSVQAAIEGNRILVDTGTYAYNREQRLRSYFRGTRAHNTVTVDGMDQAEISGRMSWRAVPRAEIIHSHFSDRLATIGAEEAGYRRLPDPVTHRRSIFFLRETGIFLILDKLASAGQHAYEMHYHFPPEVEPELQQDAGSLIVRGANAQLYVDGSCALAGKILRGNESPMGWYSSGYGQLTETSTVEVAGRGEGTVLLFSVLMPWRHERGGAAAIQSSMKDGSRMVSVEADGTRGLLAMHHDLSSRRRRELEYRARALLIHEGPSSSRGWIYAVDCELVRLDGRTLFESRKPEDIFRLLSE